MCGILFSTWDGCTDVAFRRALSRMDYRGPDAEGMLHAGSLRMGHRRLAIVDLDPHADQPFRSADGRWAIVFNGEIYNHRELAMHHRLPLRTRCDTEVLLELYVRLGAGMLDELEGMFAFVIADTITGHWFAARDRLGIKPLFLARRGGGLLLASEPSALLELSDGAVLDDVGVRQYRALRTWFNGRTIWRGVESFPAGHFMHDGTLRRWWSLPRGPQAPPADDELQALVEGAVGSHRIADVAVGSYLSGGLDSTIVAGLAQKPDTWTVGFPDDNEFPWGRMAAQRFGSRHTEALVTPAEFITGATTMIERRREPLSVPNEVLLWRMTTAVARRNTVVLSGEGADELFFGYDRIFRWAATADWDLAEFARRYAYGSDPDLEIVEDAIAPFRDRGACLDVLAAFFQVAHLHGLLRRLDAATMLCSVEARVPFVDHRLVERLAGVPFAWRMPDGEVKAPLKRVFADLVPAPIRARPKVGFPVPLDRMPFGDVAGATPMDRWFAFNLAVLTGEAAPVREAM